MCAIFKYKFERVDVEFFTIPISNFRIETYTKSNNSRSEIRTNDQTLRPMEYRISPLRRIYAYILDSAFFLAAYFRRIE